MWSCQLLVVAYMYVQSHKTQISVQYYSLDSQQDVILTAVSRQSEALLAVPISYRYPHQVSQSDLREVHVPVSSQLALSDGHVTAILMTVHVD